MVIVGQIDSEVNLYFLILFLLSISFDYAYG